MALDITKFVIRFVEEAREHVGRLGEGVAALGHGSADRESINSIFRSAHTIKGSSRMLKLHSITDTAHQLEDVLGALRDGSISYVPELGSVLYRGIDALAAMVERLAESGDAAQLPAIDTELCAALARAARGEGGVAASSAPASPAAMPAAVEANNSMPAPVEVPPSQAPAIGAPSSIAPSATTLDTRMKMPDTVRVRLAKLDELIKLMGEVVSSHAAFRQRMVEIRQIERGIEQDSEQTISREARMQARLHHFSRTLGNDIQSQELLMHELHDKALSMRMLPLAMVFEPAGRVVRDLARAVGKQVDCVVTGADIELDRQMIDKLGDPIVHLLRNAVDHGIETPAERQAAGKTAQGRITLSAHQDGGWVVVEIADDGGGISLARVREKAVRKGFVSAEQVALMSDQEVIDLIFLPGFSTSAIITDISGRGVGMDVVKQNIVDDLQGMISVDTRPGAGTTFVLRLSLSLAVMRVLLIKANGLPFGFTSQYVAELLRVPDSAVVSAAEREVVIIRNEFVPVVPLAEILRVPHDSAQPAQAHSTSCEQTMLLLVVRVRNEKLALRIDELLDERDMVIKPLPEHMRKLSTVCGMVITGRNELVSVLHAPTLMELAGKTRRSRTREDMPIDPGRPRVEYKVLVVDDSLNTREIEKDVLEAWGYHVTLAEDGLDGLHKARAGHYDAILTDVEMPNMDGFTLTANLRQEEKYRDTPIVIITSREKEEDKRRGIQVGADAYIVKGDFDQSYLVDTLRSLLG